MIPDERWSDHPNQDGLTDDGTGPDWVAAIVDAIGQSWQNSLGGGHCDYWGYPSQGSKSEPTAIFITWDDWGGFYDHVAPPYVYIGYYDTSGKQWHCDDQANHWGCGYVFGFRVPLLVVSEYTPAGYVSGNTITEGGEQPQWEHDFGSILAFTENNFGLPYIYKPYYADYNTLDSGSPPNTWVPLWDFFQGPQRTFTYISPILSTHDATFFENYYQTPQSGVYPTPLGPEYGDED